MTTLAAIRGLLEHTSDLYRWKLVQIANELGMNPDHLAAINGFETRLTYRADVENPSSHAMGELQFIPATAKAMGTSTEALRLMPPEQQLDFVRAYLLPFKGRLGNLQDAYLAVFEPRGMGHLATFVLGDRDSTDPHMAKVYAQNAALDTGKTGFIRNIDATRQIAFLLGDAEARPRIEVPDTAPLAPGPGTLATSPTTPTDEKEITVRVFLGAAALYLGWRAYHVGRDMLRTERQLAKANESTGLVPLDAP